MPARAGTALRAARACQLEVKESNAMYATTKMMPISCVSFTGASPSSLSLKMAAPVVMETATAYSKAE